ncbi:hypothetical protein [Enterococcus devriesei]|uniref:hypothetical protein n=1 Tax=Enterococcus devriesei TaxID=319970 RepID=UPI0036D2A668
MSDFATLVEFLTIVPENNTFSSETLILAGNSIPELILATGRFCQKESSIKRVVFVGGIGHGTQRLLANCQQRFPELFKQEWINFSEAEIMRELFLTICSRKLELLLEKNRQILEKTPVFLLNCFDRMRQKVFGSCKTLYYKCGAIIPSVKNGIYHLPRFSRCFLNDRF